MLKSLRTEDWTATFIGIFVLVIVACFPGLMKNPFVIFAVIALLTYAGYWFMGNKDRGKFPLAFVIPWPFGDCF